MSDITVRNRRLMLAAAVFTVILAFVVIWASSDPDALKAPIDLHLTVVHADESETEYDIRTIRTTLSEILEDEGLLEGIYVDDDENVYTKEQYDAIVEAYEAAVSESDANAAAAGSNTAPNTAASGTDADTLPMDPENIHFRVVCVDGEYTDAAAGQYWLCYQNDTRNKDAADTIEVEDEDDFRFVYYQEETEDAVG